VALFLPVMTAKPKCVSLRFECPLVLYQQITDFRFAARHETKSEAALALLTAGLAELAKPAAKEEPSKRPLIPFAGSEKLKPRSNGAMDRKSLQGGRGPSLK
jgi:hypothetical protein